MKRRSFLGMLMSLPVVARLKPGLDPAKPVMSNAVVKVDGKVVPTRIDLNPDDPIRFFVDGHDIGRVANIYPPRGAPEFVEFDLETGTKEYRPSPLKRYTDVAMNVVPINREAEAILARAMAEGRDVACRLVTAPTTFSFQAYVLSWAPTFPVDGLHCVNLSLRPTCAMTVEESV